jgi:hypothetical protein
MAETLQDKQQPSREHAGRALWQLMQKYVQGVPLSELEKLPEDAASHHNHYLYGIAKDK